jgi:hypothetical protein
MNKILQRSVMLTAVIIFASVISGLSCVPANNPVKIISVDVADPYMFVQTHQDLICNAVSATGDKITYTWSCDGGTLTGEGQKVNWTSPNEYNTYHIMVTAKDSKGNSDQATATITVIYNKTPFECPSCKK